MKFHKPLFAFGVLLLFISCNSNTTKNHNNRISSELVLSSGNYTGLWNSTTKNRSFKNLPISAIIRQTSQGNFDGELFISDNFESCCNSGNNDGTFSFAVENYALSNFKYNDIIPNCSGVFIGSGKLLEDNSIIINITGTDCDGNHKGTITLSK